MTPERPIIRDRGEDDERAAPDVVSCQWVRDEDGVWSHMQFDDDETNRTVIGMEEV